MGTRSISFDRFSHLWVNQLLFVVHNRREMAQFNLDSDWHVAPPAPLFQGIDRDRLLESLPVRRAGAF